MNSTARSAGSEASFKLVLASIADPAACFGFSVHVGGRDPAEAPSADPDPAFPAAPFASESPFESFVSFPRFFRRNVPVKSPDQPLLALARASTRSSAVMFASAEATRSSSVISVVFAVFAVSGTSIARRRLDDAGLPPDAASAPGGSENPGTRSPKSGAG